MQNDRVLRVENPADRWIADIVIGKSFVDVGGLWGTVNEKVTVAAAAGAARVAAIDITPLGSSLWELFLERCRARGVMDVECRAGDLNQLEVADETLHYDVVHCSGVLYHCIHPLHTIQRLAAMSRRNLILATTVIPERIVSQTGTLVMEPGAALFVPAMTAVQKQIVTDYFREVGATSMWGIDVDCQWDPADYAPWWWLFTRQHVAALLKVAGLEVRQVEDYWSGRVAYFLTEPGAKEQGG